MSSPEDHDQVTLRDIARAVGVSHVTVSLALRNNPKLPEARRQQIQALAQQMGYRPNAIAAALAHHKKTAAVTPIKAGLAWLNRWSEPRKLRAYKEFDQYWRGAYAAAEKFGYRLEEFIVNPKSMSLSRLEKVLLARGIRGILLPPHRDVSDWGNFPWEKFSVVRFGRSLPTPRVHLVTADQAGDAILAFHQMRAKGYKRIGWVSAKTPRDQRNCNVLFDGGFFTVQAGLEKGERVPILNLDPDQPHTHPTALKRWLEREKPDAILTEHPTAGRLLKKCGYRVPKDIGLAATTLLDTDATAGIDQHPEEIGRVGTLVLLSQINDHARGIPPIFRQILIEGQWVDGASLPDRSSRAGAEKKLRGAAGKF